jgi:hypothetical protein
MRHLLSLLFGIVLAPVIWFLTALGHFRVLEAQRRFSINPDRLPIELAFGAVLIVAAGIWLGVLLSSRLSPLAPGAAAAAWLAVAVAFVADGQKVTDLLPNGPTGQPGLFALPVEHGYAFLVGSALLVPLFSPARWRGRYPVRHPVEGGAASPAGATSYPSRGDQTDQTAVRDVANRYSQEGRGSHRDDAAGRRESPAEYRESTAGRRAAGAGFGTTSGQGHTTGGFTTTSGPGHASSGQGHTTGGYTTTSGPGHTTSGYRTAPASHRDDAGYPDATPPWSDSQRPEPRLPWENDEPTRGRSRER